MRIVGGQETLEEEPMFAVLGNSKIDPDRIDEVESILKERLVPKFKAMGGFVSGTWTFSLDDARGTGMSLWETEADARAAIDMILGMPTGPEAPFVFGAFDVVRVVHQA
jgi:hypothetical protein